MRIARVLLLCIVVAGCSDPVGPTRRFSIEIRYPPAGGVHVGVPVSNVPQVVREALEEARTLWERAVTGALPPVRGRLHGAWENCGVFDDEIIDNLLVYVHAQGIDGPGGINAYASTCLMREGNPPLPLIEHITFDLDNIPALVEAGKLFDVAVHELGHALGFGKASFKAAGCLQEETPFVDGQPDPRDTHFSCPRALAAFNAIGGEAYTAGKKVPLENCAIAYDPPCIEGRANSHWRQSVFYDEIMATYLDAVPEILSRVTLAALEDIGHKVDYSAASAWLPLLPVAPSSGAIYMGADVVEQGPIPVVNQQGQVVRFLSP